MMMMIMEGFGEKASRVCKKAEGFWREREVRE